MGSKLRKKLRLFWLRFLNDTTAMADVSSSRIITYAIGFFLVGILMPLGLAEIYAANTTGWNSNVTTMFQTLFPIIAIVAIALDFYQHGRKGD